MSKLKSDPVMDFALIREIAEEAIPKARQWTWRQGLTKCALIRAALEDAEDIYEDAKERDEGRS